MKQPRAKRTPGAHAGTNAGKTWYFHSYSEVYKEIHLRIKKKMSHLKPTDEDKVAAYDNQNRVKKIIKKMEKLRLVIDKLTTHIPHKVNLCI